MKTSEVIKLYAALTVAYPRLPEANELTIEMWNDALKDVDYKTAEVAIKKIILTSTFPPSIAEVRAAVTSIMIPDILTAADAWGEVQKALRLYGYYRTQEAIDSMSELTVKTVKYIGWSNICLCEESGVVRGQFLKMYEQVANRKRSEVLLPVALKDEIRKISEKFGNLKLLQSKKAEHDQKISEGG